MPSRSIWLRKRNCRLAGPCCCEYQMCTKKGWGAFYIFKRQTKYHCYAVCLCETSEQTSIGSSFHTRHKEIQLDLFHHLLDGQALSADSSAKKWWGSTFSEKWFRLFWKPTSGIVLMTSLHPRQRNVVFVCLYMSIWPQFEEIFYYQNVNIFCQSPPSLIMLFQAPLSLVPGSNLQFFRVYF